MLKSAEAGYLVGKNFKKKNFEEVYNHANEDFKINVIKGLFSYNGGLNIINYEEQRRFTIKVKFGSYNPEKVEDLEKWAVFFSDIIESKGITTHITPCKDYTLGNFQSYEFIVSTLGDNPKKFREFFSPYVRENEKNKSVIRRINKKLKHLI